MWAGCNDTWNEEIRMTDNQMSLVTAHYSPVIRCSDGAAVVGVWMIVGWRRRRKVELVVQHDTVCKINSHRFHQSSTDVDSLYHWSRRSSVWISVFV